MPKVKIKGRRSKYHPSPPKIPEPAKDPIYPTITAHLSFNNPTGRKRGKFLSSLSYEEE